MATLKEHNVGASAHLRIPPGSSLSAALQAGTARHTGPIAARSARWGRRACSRWVAGQERARAAGERGRAGARGAGERERAGAGGAGGRERAGAAGAAIPEAKGVGADLARAAVALLAGTASLQPCRCSCRGSQVGDERAGQGGSLCFGTAATSAASHSLA